MRGERLDVADMGWHGLDGDRRLAFRRPDDQNGFPCHGQDLTSKVRASWDPVTVVYTKKPQDR